MKKAPFASLLIVPIAFGQTALTTAQIAKKVSPSVLVIQGKTDSGDVLGSGFIVSKDGKIVTNLHVITDMKTASIHLANGKTFDSVSVLAIDERRDLAIVKIVGVDLPVLELGNSDALTIGEPLVILGSPRGLEGTVTAGILSSVRNSGEGFKVLQTDAAVNPGNSGGPLLNNKGQAIGVVSFKLKSSEGLNFAIPINYVRGLLDNLHDPMTLAEMRKDLSAIGTPETNIADLSVKESVQWLKDRLALETFNYVAPSTGETSTFQQQALVDSESCTPTFAGLIRLRKPAAQEWLPESGDRRTVPLSDITNAFVGKAPVKLLWSNTDNISSGDEWSYGVFLGTKTPSILTVKLLPPNQPETTNADFATLIFHDESVANRALAVLLHAADLCRKTATPTPKPTASGPSAKDTLDWLKEKIPLATVQSVRSEGEIPVSATFESTVWTFDSCTVAFGRLLTIRSGVYSKQMTTKYTLPLGALTGSSVAQVEYWAFANFIKGDRYGYRLSLTSKSKDISVTYSGQDAPPDESTDTLYLIFRDEDLARRVGTAFLHAADLCRTKAPF
jgi:hypothetical protein